MLKILSILVVLAAVIFALTYFYKPSKLELTPKMVILKVGAKDCNYPYAQMKKEVQNFSNLKLEQYILEGEKERFVLEIATVDGLYEFNDNPQAILSKIFKIKQSQPVFSKNGLEAQQLILADGAKLNLFMLQVDTKELKLLYGMSDEAFSRSVEKLVQKQVEPIHASKVDRALSLWSSKVNDMDGVIVSIDH